MIKKVAFAADFGFESEDGGLREIICIFMGVRSMIALARYPFTEQYFS